MEAGGVAGKVGRPGATALVLSLPAVLAVCLVVVEAWLRVLALRTPQLP